jgi:hypothetical protein
VPEHCPFLDQNDTRCAEHFRVAGLGQAFEHCLGAYRVCPIYRQIRRGLASKRMQSSTPELVKLTVHGRDDAETQRPSLLRNASRNEAGSIDEDCDSGASTRSRTTGRRNPRAA